MVPGKSKRREATVFRAPGGTEQPRRRTKGVSEEDRSFWPSRTRRNPQGRRSWWWTAKAKKKKKEELGVTKLDKSGAFSDGCEAKGLCVGQKGTMTEMEVRK